MNAVKVNSPSESGSEERGGVSRAHLHLKENATKWLALKRAVFDRVKKLYFTLPLRNVNQTMLQTFHEDPKESYQLVQNGHPMTLNLI